MLVVGIKNKWTFVKNSQQKRSEIFTAWEHTFDTINHLYCGTLIWNKYKTKTETENIHKVNRCGV